MDAQRTRHAAKAYSRSPAHGMGAPGAIGAANRFKRLGKRKWMASMRVDVPKFLLSSATPSTENSTPNKNEKNKYQESSFRIHVTYA